MHAVPDEVLEVVLAPLAEPLPPRLSPFSLFEWDEISFFRLARVSKQWQRVVDQRADPWAHSLGWKRVIIHRVRRPVDRRRHAPVINGPGELSCLGRQEKDLSEHNMKRPKQRLMSATSLSHALGSALFIPSSCVAKTRTS